MTHAASTSVSTGQVDWLKLALGELTVINIGFYAAMSLLSLHLLSTLEMNSAQTAAILLASSLGLRVSRFFLAPLMDRLAMRQSLIIFSIIGAMGYIGLYSFTGFLPVFLSVFLVGTGYGCNGLLVTTLSSFAPERYKRHIYSVQYTLANVAAAAGPFIVYHYIAPTDAFLPFLFSGAMFVLGSLVAWRIDASQLPACQSPKKFHHHALELLKRPDMLRLLATIAIGWMLYTQKFAMLPLFVTDHMNAPTLVGTMMLVFSGVIIATAIPFSALSAKKQAPTHMMIAIGIALYALAYLLIAAWPGVAALFTGIALCALAEAITIPSFNVMIRDITEPSERLAGFALGALAIAIGEFAGMSGGVEAFRHFAKSGQAMDALLGLGLVGLACLAFYLLVLMPKPLSESPVQT